MQYNNYVNNIVSRSYFSSIPSYSWDQTHDLALHLRGGYADHLTKSPDHHPVAS